MIDPDAPMTPEEWEILDEFLRLIQVQQPSDCLEINNIISTFKNRYPQMGERFESLANSRRDSSSSGPEVLRNGEKHSNEASRDAAPDESDPIGAVWPEELNMNPVHLGNYRLLSEIGRGGMGIVFKAEQISLGRRLVAVKILPSPDPKALGLFIKEANVGGQLAHSNIVFVFDIDRDGDIHYIVMQYVEGWDLSRTLETLRDGVENDPEPTVREPAGVPTGILAGLASPKTRPRTAASLCIQVAKALEHSHGRDVAHRDIKPSNILIDQGVARVVDFGIASLTRASSGTIADGSVDDGSDEPFSTEDADWLGTARYMPPEYQPPDSTAGTGRRGSRRSPFLYDIYSLGMTLYELATLQRPFDDLSGKRMRAEICSGQLRRPREIDRQIPPDLEGIILKAIARNPAERYQTASDFREDLERFLAGRPVKARPIDPIRRFWKYCKRKPYQVGTAISLSLVVAFAALWAWNYVSDMRDRESKLAYARADLGKTLARARKADPYESSPWREVRETAERDKSLLSPPDPRLLEELDQAIREASRNEKAAKLLLALTAVREAEFNDPDGLATDERYQSLFQDFGLNFDISSINQATEVLKFLPRLTLVELTATLDDWAGIRRWRKLPSSSWQKPMLLAKALDPDPDRNRLRDLCLDPDGGDKRLQNLREMAAAPRAAAQSSQHILILAKTLGTSGDLEAEETLLRKAVLEQQNDLWINHELAVCLLRRGGRERIAEAIRFFSVARATRHQVAFDLGVALTAGGQLKQACAVYTELLRSYPQDEDGYVSCALGQLLKMLGEFEKAEAAFVQAAKKLEAEIRLHPNRAEAQNTLGVVYYALDRLDDAIARFREAIRINSNSASAHSNLGVLLLARDKRAAEEECKRAVLLRPDSASFHNDLGTVLADLNRAEEAVSEFREAIRLQPDNADAHCNLARTLSVLGQHEAAEAEYREAVRLIPTYAVVRYNMGIWLLGRGLVEGAVQEFREAIRLQPDYAEAHSSLGLCLHELGLALRSSSQSKQDQDQARRTQAYFEEAAKECREAIRLRPGMPQFHVNLAVVLLSQGHGAATEAEQECRQAIRLSPDYAEAHYNRGRALHGLNRFEEAADACRAAIEHRIDFAEAYCILGITLWKLGRCKEGLDAVKRGHELGMKRAKWSVPSAEWVQEGERLAALESRIPVLRSGLDQEMNPSDLATLMWICITKKFYASATRCFADSIRNQPDQAADPSSNLRYNGACVSALAGCGQGKDASSVEDPSRGRFRDQALRWLDADLTCWEAHLKSDSITEEGRKAILGILSGWLENSDFEGVRDKGALEMLPEAERKEWRAFWLRVRNLVSS